VVTAVRAPVCLACAIALGRLISSEHGPRLYRIWRARELPSVGQPSSARWHATAAKIWLGAGEYPVALRHAGLALLAAQIEDCQDDVLFALQHSLEVALSPRIYRPDVSDDLRGMMFPA
jgi:hypothetical protein